MMIKLTDSAKEQMQALMINNNVEAFYFGVTGGGCAGFNYDLHDTTLDKKQDDDEIMMFDDVPIIVDGASMMYIIGTEIDYAAGMMGSSFKFDNPVSMNSCGCGTSFSV